MVDFFTCAKTPYKSKNILQNPPYWKSEWSWTPYEEMVSVLGIPSTNAPFCSDQLKRKAIESYLKSIGWKKYYTAIGMRYDEPKRLKKNADKKKLIYILVDYTVMAKYDILAWWANYKFNLTVEEGFGNCDNCWKKSLKQLINNYKKRPYSFDWWQHITDTYGHMNPRESDLKPPFNFFRGNLSPKDIKQLAESKQEINETINESELGCSESCEAFN